MSAHVWERMSAYIDRELPQTERAGVEAHLRECAECARAIEEMRAVDALARGHEFEAPAGYFDGLPGRLRGRLSPRTRARVAPWTLALAAGLAVAVLAPLALREQPSPLAPPPEVPAPPATLPPAATAAPPPAVEEPAPVAARSLAFRAPARPSPPAEELARRERGDAQAANEQRRKEEAGPGRLDATRTADRMAPRVVAGQREASGMAPAAPPAAAPVEVDAAGQEAEAEDDAPLVSDNSGPERKSSARTPSTAARGTALRSLPADARFQALAGRAARSAAEARALRDAWQSYVRDNPEGPHADEARVGALEAGAAAWRLGGLREDRAQVEKDGREYLRRPEAADKERVRALLAGLEP
jgi:hypothetical protein